MASVFSKFRNWLFEKTDSTTTHRDVAIDISSKNKFNRAQTGNTNEFNSYDEYLVKNNINNINQSHDRIDRANFSPLMNAFVSRKADEIFSSGLEFLSKDDEKPIKDEITQCDDMVLCERIQERITRLASGVAVIRVGASTEVEMIEKKHRIEDALEAVSSAQEEGILAGGGTALFRVGVGLAYKDWGEVMSHSDQRWAISILREAFKAPLRVMCENAGESFDLISQQLFEDNVVWDFVNEEVVDAFEAGILDPVKVTKNLVIRYSIRLPGSQQYCS